MAEAMMADEPAYAGFWRRVVALSFDSFLLVGWALPVLVILTGTQIVWIVQIVGAALFFFYFAVMEGSPLQATAGKLLVGIYVTDSEGRRVSLLRALGRNLLKNILFAIPIINLSILMAAFTSRKQAPYDMLAGTLVMRRDGAGTARAIGIYVVSVAVMFAGVSVFSKTFEALKKIGEEQAASENSDSSPPPVASKPRPKPVAEDKAQPIPAVAPTQDAGVATRQVAVPAAPARAESNQARPAPPAYDDEARRKADNDLQAARRLAAQRELDAKPRPKARTSDCVYKPVMTDEDLAKCR